MFEPLNILVLHRLGNPAMVAEFLKEHVFALRTAFPEHNYIYHDTNLPVPGYLKDAHFDAILLDVTLLCARWSSPRVFAKVLEDYDFVRQSSAAKIAFPQDEYDCNELLDDWMMRWAVDVVFSVISSDWDVLYPKFHRAGEIRLGFTGYVDEALLKMVPRPFADRTIDIGYRARKLPPYFGRLGEVKWTIGRDVERLARQAGLQADIVLGEQGTLLGRAWRDFLNNSKFTLGSNSGSSMLDPRGDIQRCVRAYLRRSPNAGFDEVESKCFSGLDGKHSFTAISPRVLEAAVLESCQVLVEGEYSGIIRPWEDYIPIKPDASDFPEVLKAMTDRSLVSRLVSNCRQTILECKEVRQHNQSADVIACIRRVAEEKRPGSNADTVKRIAQRYESEMTARYRSYWKKVAMRQRVIRKIDAYPLLSRIARGALAAIRRFQ